MTDDLIAFVPLSTAPADSALGFAPAARLSGAARVAPRLRLPEADARARVPEPAPFERLPPFERAAPLERLVPFERLVPLELVVRSELRELERFAPEVERAL
jgi:hypothetical protein